MKYPLISAALAAALLSGCSNKAEEEAVAAEKAAEAEAQSEELKSSLSKGISDLGKSADKLKSDLNSKISDQEKAVDSKLEEQKAEMEAKLEDQKAEMDAKLEDQKAELKAEFAKQTEALVAQYSKQTSGITDQFEGLKSKYQAAKAALPEDTVQTLDAKIPQIDLSLNGLTQLVNKFSPETMEQVDSFKQEYASEFETAQKLIAEGLAVLKEGGIKMPSF